MLGYRLLGRSGLRVSEICLGAMSFGEKWGFGADPKESRRAIDAYGEAGGNFIDTANKYHEGQSEEIVGEAVRSRRDRWVIATKYTLSMDTSDPNASGNSRKNMMQSVNQSLRRLGTDYIDLLWVHAWDFTSPVEEVMRGLDDLVRAGKILYAGISDAPAWVVSQANTLASLRGWTPFVALQIEYSLIERTVERELLPMADAFGLTVTPWAPIGGGVLTGKYTRGSGVPEDTKRSEGNQRRLTDTNLRIAREVDVIADEIGRPSAQVSLNWVRQRGSNLLPIVGARKTEQIVELLGAVEFEPGEEHMSRLEAASRIDLGFPHDFASQQYIRTILYGEAEGRIALPRAAKPRNRP